MLLGPRLGQGLPPHEVLDAVAHLVAPGELSMLDSGQDLPPKKDWVEVG